MVSKTLHYSICKKCGYTAISKRAINVIDLLAMVIGSILIKIFLIPMLPEVIPQVVFWAIPAIWLTLLSLTAKERCRGCMSTELEFISEETYKEKLKEEYESEKTNEVT